MGRYLVDGKQQKTIKDPKQTTYRNVVIFVNSHFFNSFAAGIVRFGRFMQNYQ